MTSDKRLPARVPRRPRRARSSTPGPSALAGPDPNAACATASPPSPTACSTWCGAGRPCHRPLVGAALVTAGPRRARRARTHPRACSSASSATIRAGRSSSRRSRRATSGVVRTGPTGVDRRRATPAGRLPLRRRLQPRRRRDHDHRDRRHGRRGQPGVLRDVRPRPRGVRRHPTCTCSPASTTSPAPSRRCAACSTASATRSRLERTYLHRDGSPVRVQASLSLVRGPAGEPRYVICLVEDVTERFRLQSRLRFHADHDPLTGLATRAVLADRLQLALDEPGRRPVGVCAIDLDGFRGVNDTLGHDIGDELLRAVARPAPPRPRRRTGTSWPARAATSSSCSPSTSTRSALRALAGRALAAVAQPFELGGHRVVVTATVGIVPGDGIGLADAGALLQAADTTLNRAKRHGRGGVAEFEPRLHRRAVSRFALAARMADALADGRVLPRVPAAGPAGRRRARRRRGAGPLEPARPGSGSGPTGSSRSPRRPGSSSRSAGGCSRRRAGRRRPGRRAATPTPSRCCCR